MQLRLHPPSPTRQQPQPPARTPCPQACLACNGVVIFTGVGKSGLIAQKICQTLVSTGTKAVFLSPQVLLLAGAVGAAAAGCHAPHARPCILPCMARPCHARLPRPPRPRPRRRRLSAHPLGAPPPLSLTAAVPPPPHTHHCHTAGCAARRHRHHLRPGPAGLFLQVGGHRGNHPPRALRKGGYLCACGPEWVWACGRGGGARAVLDPVLCGCARPTTESRRRGCRLPPPPMPARPPAPSLRARPRARASCPSPLCAGRRWSRRATWGCTCRWSASCAPLTWHPSPPPPSK